MEPLNAVVRLNEAGDKAEVWEGSQAPDESRKAVAKALGLKEVRWISTNATWAAVSAAVRSATTPPSAR
jgi:CO/xanthine dehydrogenase Mo-binding subunit